MMCSNTKPRRNRGAQARSIAINVRGRPRRAISRQFVPRPRRNLRLLWRRRGRPPRPDGSASFKRAARATAAARRLASWDRCRAAAARSSTPRAAAAVARAQFRSRRSISRVSRRRPLSALRSKVALFVPQTQSTQSLTIAAGQRWRGGAPGRSSAFVGSGWWPFLFSFSARA